MQTYTKNMARALVGRGHEVHIMSCGGDENRDYEQEGVSVHVRRLHRVRGMRRVFRSPRSALALELALSCWRETKRLGIPFDVVEVPDFRAEGFLLTLLRKQAVVVRIHTRNAIEVEYEGVRPGRFDLWLVTKLEGLGPRYADASTCCTAKLIGEMRSAGLDCGRSPEVIRHPTAPRWPLPGTPARDPLVLAVGRLEPRKAPDLLIQAVHLLTSDVPEVEIVFVGRHTWGTEDGGYRDSLSALADGLGVRVRWEGEVPIERLQSLYQQARVVAIASHQEGFSNAGLEAMLSGRPIACSTGAGIAEVIDDTKAGKVFEAGDADRLADALRPFLLNESVASEAGAAAHAIATTEFSPDRFAREMEHVYTGAIDAFAKRRSHGTRATTMRS